ncbi:hypothetical protein [Sodalis sp. dw_96]|uniref:hypothetical protein n=1 Tax=Sodalis sp. dw_96 TaxID=2719794 RepID=UPI001BD31D39|nr:hypothetical protein [Sodalis sp. dw_96]
MPISQQVYRNNIGNYQVNNSKKMLTPKAQQILLNDLAKYPGDAKQRARAEVMLQSILMVSNISLAISGGHIAHHTTQSRGRRSPVDFTKTPGDALRVVYPENGVIHGLNHSLPLQAERLFNPGTSMHGLQGGHMITRLQEPTTTIRPPAKGDLDSDVTAPVFTTSLTTSPPTRSAVKDELYQKSPADPQTENVKHFLAKHAGGKPFDDSNMNAVIEGAIEHIIRFPDGLEKISRELIKHTGEYGAHDKEALAEWLQFRIVRNWLSAQVFEISPDEFIGRIISQSITENKCHGGQPLRLPVDTLYNAVLNNIAIHSLQRSPETNDTTFLNEVTRNYIYHEIILDKLPYLEMDHATVNENNIYIGTADWGLLHAGLMIVNNAKKDSRQFSVDELVQIGSSFEGMLREGVADPELIKIFELPAKLFYVKHHAERGTGISFKEIFRTDEGNKLALEAFFAAVDLQKIEENPYHQFTLAWENYRTRTQLKEELMKKTQVVTADKLTSVPFCLSKGHLENPLTDDANQLFNQQNENIATKYAAVDTLMVALAFEKSAADEIFFLRGAEIYTTSAVFSAFSTIRNQMFARAIPRHAYTVQLASTVDLFIALNKEKKRIYALELIDDKYSLLRVDYQENLYRALMADREKLYRDSDYKLKVYDDIYNAQLLKNTHEPLEQLVGQLIKKHRKKFLNNLHELGYEETGAEKTKRFLLSLIPFYNCINDIKDEKREASLSCTIDMFVLLPLAGQGAGLAARFGQQGVRGGMMALRATMSSLAAREMLKVAIRQGTLQFTRHGILPAAEELNRKALIQMGLAALRSVDPGMELMGMVGIGAFRRIAAAAHIIKRTLPAWEKVLPSLDTVLSLQDVPASINKIKTGRLPGLDKDIPVRKLAGDRFNRQPVYVQIDPLTGDAFGKKYTLSATGILHAVPKPMAQHLKNILVTGFSGRGAAKYAKDLAAGSGNLPPAVQHASPVTADHLLRWLDNTRQTNPVRKKIFLEQFGLSESAWSSYVSSSNVLTARAQALLARAEVNDVNYLLTRSQVARTEIIRHLGVRPLQHLSLVSSRYANTYAGLSSVRIQAEERLAVLLEQYSDGWKKWLLESPPQSRRWFACEILNAYVDQGNHYLSLAGFNLKDAPPFLPDDVLHLDLSFNGIKVLNTPLPRGLEWLHIGKNSLDALPDSLPETLVALDASHNVLPSVPELKSSVLTHLDLSWNKLTSLPRLPQSLIYLDVSANHLHRLPIPLPEGLSCLIANNNKLVLLPDLLPRNLENLDVRHNGLMRLSSEMPSGIKHIDVSYNKLRFLPGVLSKDLVYLNACHNLLDILPQLLPPKLKKLLVSHNSLTFLSIVFPPNLDQLQVSANMLSALPQNLPLNLKILWANNNQISSLPKTLPPGITSLSVNYNKITELTDDTLPTSLQVLHITHNRLSRLPQTFPSELQEIDVSYTRVPGRPDKLPPSVRFIQNG